jgi:hypothetical protein
MFRRTSRRTLPRPAAIALGALALVCAIAPFLPDASTPEPGIAPSGSGSGLRTSSTAGPGRVTPAMQAEIDRVVAAGAVRPAARRTPASAVRCAAFDGQRYCLGVGWTTQSQDQVQARMTYAAQALAARRTRVETTGDLDAAATLARTARLSPAARARRERAELTAAARSVAKVWLLRHEVQGVPLPAGFADAHPEARLTTAAANGAAASAKTAADYPQSAIVLDETQVAQQSRYYWCGPSAMQMMAWGWRQRRQPQKKWARKIGTSTAGSAITDVVRVINTNTGWDRAEHAGTYITLDIGDFTFDQWYLLMMRHVTDYTAPVLLHPVLQKRYYPYLDDDASGHFQVGRGYDQNPAGEPLLGYFEPWNQQAFDPSEPYIARAQWQSAYQQYRANQAHFQHNVGV